MVITKKITQLILKLNISRSNKCRYVRNHYHRIYKAILKQTSFLDKFAKDSSNPVEISIFERLYCIEHNLSDRPIC